MMSTILLLVLASLSISLAQQVTTFLPFDLTPITLYGPTAVYLPDRCPAQVSFHARARPLAELATNKIGLFPNDISVNGHRCSADAEMLVFDPIGKPKGFPPQWTFEDSRVTGLPVNFTCGDERFSIRFGYFNDVKTQDGFLDPKVVYLDFAVIPNTKPFGFCSYRNERSDGGRPIDYLPFPTKAVWDTLVQIQDSGVEIPFPEQSVQPDVPENSAEVELMPSPYVWDEQQPFM